ncbi:hypothetical protein OG588_27520 [Streptomyces prunicolor]|uniref:hypothetical protein n=1 Tax=Streptomyces prunicolor TaxID=67348 RepID=UPI00386831BD|nr:hypothetical protein OG588_27520 [Streptomyces prunicolor]
MAVRWIVMGAVRQAEVDHRRLEGDQVVVPPPGRWGVLGISSAVLLGAAIAVTPVAHRRRPGPGAV